MQFNPRDRFSKSLLLSESEISAFASAAGDANPLHHDREYASTSRYGGIIASGPQTSALLMGLVASHFSDIGPMVGLDFSFRFRAPVPAGDAFILEWLIIRVERKEALGGHLVELRGRLQTSSGVTAVGAKGTVVVVQAA